MKGVLLDITGVLVESSATGDGKAIPGSVEAVRKLKEAGEDRMRVDSLYPIRGTIDASYPCLVIRH